jgi:hypothetical protein
MSSTKNISIDEAVKQAIEEVELNGKMCDEEILKFFVLSLEKMWNFKLMTDDDIDEDEGEILVSKKVIIKRVKKIMESILVAKDK